MSNPTSNFNWQMPTATDLVTDLPADFEVFGQAVDTSLADLRGGTTGQVLKKNTDTDMDFVWAADSAGMTNPMTTTGDTIYSSSGSTPARLGIGSTGQVLTVAAGVPSWAAAPSASSNYSLVNAGGTALTGAGTITISGITNANKLMIIVAGGGTASGNFITFRFNSDTAANYNFYGYRNTFAATLNTGDFNESGLANQTAIDWGRMPPGSGNLISGFLSLDGGNAAGTKVFNGLSASGDVSANDKRQWSNGGWWNNSSTVSSVSLISGTNWTAGTIYVYKSA